jgi:predicted  nucleic acid-binding Zn-ribbon protein
MKLRRLLKKEIYEIKKTAQDMNDEFNKVMENLKKESNRNSGNKNSLIK